MGNCNCGSGSDTAVLTVETDLPTQSSSCCGAQSTSQTDDAGCCSDSDSCSTDCTPTSEVSATVSAGKSSCC